MEAPPVLPPLRTSSSWFTSSPPEPMPPSTPRLAQSTPGSTKFGTVSGPVRRQRTGLAFFNDDEDDHELEGAGGQQRGRVAIADPALLDLQGLGRSPDEEDWSISVAELHSSRAKVRGKKHDPILTVYVSTPTSSLTLSRSYQSILDFDARIRSQLPGRLPPGLPSLPPVPKKRGNVLQTLSRTLSPRRPPRSNSVGGGGATPSTLSARVDVAEVGQYFSRLAADPLIRSQSTWAAFFRTRADDLESVRVERRIKRVRSDVGQVTNHLSMVPLSTQVDLDPSPALDDDFAAVPPQHPNEPSAGSSTTESSSSEGALVDSTNVQKVDLFPTSPSTTTDLHAAVVKLGIVRELDGDSVLAPRREPSDLSADLLHSDENSAQFELPPRPNSADQDLEQQKRPTSRIIEMPHAKPASPKVARAPALSIDSFDIMRVLGKGCAGKVLLVRQQTTGSLYALKAIHKHHVLAHRELDHTRTEQIVLKRCSRDQSNPFVVRLHYSFHDKETLYLALDFHPGGDLATQLARWGRLGRDRTRFYTAEIVEGVEGLHRAGVIYRDLKPENILISEAGHIVLTDFGLSKDFGHASIPPSTAEGREEGAPPAPSPHWLSSSAPASRSVSTPPSAWVLLGEPYSYEVDSWSLGTMLYEMLAGVTPFWSEDHSTMYRRVLHEDLAFDDDTRVFDDDTKSLLRGLLQRNPLLRMTDARIKRHPYFSMIEWPHVFYKRYVPPFIPSLNPLDPADTSQFDDTYTSQMPRVSNEDGTGAPGDEREVPDGEPQAAFDEAGHDVFDGYSYFGGRDADSIVGPSSSDSEGEADEVDEDEDSELPPASPEPSLAVTSPTPAPLVVDDDADLDGDRSVGLTDQTFSSMTSLSTPGTSIMHLSPEQPRRRQPSSAMVVEEEDTGEQSAEEDWDVIDADVGGEAKNGGKQTTLWSKGVKDRYRLLLSSTPRGPSPLRPSTNTSRGGSRKESSGSARSSDTPSPSLVPEARRSLRRLASVRSSNSAKDRSSNASSSAIKARPSQRSLGPERDILKRSASSSAADTPRKAGQAMKRLASAFRIP